MANTKQAKKMIRKTKRRTQYNRWWKINVKSKIKEVDSVISQKDLSEKEVIEANRSLQKTLDKASKNNVIHKNKVNRIKSKYANNLTQLVSTKPKAESKTSGTKSTKSSTKS